LLHLAGAPRERKPSIFLPRRQLAPDLIDRFIDEFGLPRETQRIIWVTGRTKTDGPHDYDAVHEIEAGFKITPLSEWGRTPRAVEVKTDQSVDMRTPPKKQVDTMPGVGISD
jgi:hypothetical protein